MLSAYSIVELSLNGMPFAETQVAIIRFEPTHYSKSLIGRYRPKAVVFALFLAAFGITLAKRIMRHHVVAVLQTRGVRVHLDYHIDLWLLHLHVRVHHHWLLLLHHARLLLHLLLVLHRARLLLYHLLLDGNPLL